MANPDTSRLEACNTMLAIIGEAPANSLTVNVSEDLAGAIRTLEEVNRRLQSLGWHWNTEVQVTITANSSTKFEWEADWIRVDSDPGRYTDTDIVRRGQFLFNKAPRKNTDVFPRSTMLVDIVRYIDWDALPETVRSAIMLRAARVFAFRELGDEHRSGYSKLDEDQAMEDLIQTENEQADYNFESRGIPALSRRSGGGVFPLPAW